MDQSNKTKFMLEWMWKELYRLKREVSYSQLYKKIHQRVRLKEHMQVSSPIFENQKIDLFYWQNHLNENLCGVVKKK